MSTRHDFESESARTLRAASSEYEDLPRGVADRLDRVLEQLPAADTLHPRRESAPGWGERLRLKRVRYALVSATAAILVTIGGVAFAVQYFGSTGAGDAAVSEGGGDAGERAQEDAGAQDTSDLDAAQEEELSAPGGAEETTGVETFSTGTDYAPGSDLLSALRDLGDEAADAEVPPELVPLADGGASWRDCHDAIVERYESLIVAVDFARYDTEPAVVALLVSESGEIAVAVTPECARGVIVELASQR